MVNKLSTHTSDFANYEVESLSSDRKYTDGVYTKSTDNIRLWGYVPGKYAILIDYTIKYYLARKEDYEHTITGSIFSEDENGKFRSTNIPNDVDSIDALIRYLQTTLK